jgi:hypothetical protein
LKERTKELFAFELRSLSNKSSLLLSCEKEDLP